MKQLIGLLIAALTLVGCTNDAPDPTEGMSDEVFRGWMAKYAPQAELIEKDIYIQFVEHGMTNPNLSPDADSMWVQLRYTVHTLDGTVVATRNEEVSKYIGKWAATTHFSDDFSSLSSYYTTLNIGLRRGLQQMHEGDSARIFIPAKYGYVPTSQTFNSGYLGEVKTFTDIPLYFDVRLVEIVKKPIERELQTVNSYAASVWSQSITDTLASGIYMRKLTQIPTADTVSHTEYSLVDVTRYFFDGFIISTTLDSVAKANGIYDSDLTTYKPLEVSVSSSTSIELKLISKALKKMRYGEEAEIIAISNWTTEGAVGLFTATPQILSYTPRLFKIKVHVPEAETTTK